METFTTAIGIFALLFILTFLVTVIIVIARTPKYQRHRRYRKPRKDLIFTHMQRSDRIKYKPR